MKKQSIANVMPINWNGPMTIKRKINYIWPRRNSFLLPYLSHSPDLIPNGGIDHCLHQRLFWEPRRILLFERAGECLHVVNGT